jgi:hypothetical protein
MDPITLLNLILCVIIATLGYVVYRRKKFATVLSISLAFALFGLSHLVTLIGLASSLQDLLIVIRTVAYLATVFALVRAWQTKSTAG